MSCSKCPAAKLIAGVVPQMHGSYCTIEEGFIPYTESSYVNFCIGEYSRCTTWRDHQQKYWRDKETYVKQRRAEMIQSDEAADAVVAGEANLEDMLD